MRDLNISPSILVKSLSNNTLSPEHVIPETGKDFQRESGLNLRMFGATTSGGCVDEGLKRLAP